MGPLAPAQDLTIIWMAGRRRGYGGRPIPPGAVRALAGPATADAGASPVLTRPAALA